MECQDQYVDGAIRGKLLLVPNQKILEDTQSGQDLARFKQPDVWNKNNERMSQVSISGESQQCGHKKFSLSKNLSFLTMAKPPQSEVLLNHLANQKTDRSHSFSNPGDNMDTLNLPDSRRYSCATNESVVSSTSSLSDFWTEPENGFSEHQLQQHSLSPLIFDPQCEDAKITQTWSQNSEFDGCSLLNESKDHDKHFPSDYSSFQETRSSGTDMDSQSGQERRSSGFSSDSGFGGIPGCTSLPVNGFNQDKQQFSQMGLGDSRRDSMYSNYSDRRSSGFSSDFDRRDSNTSNSDRFCSSSGYVKSASSSNILKFRTENMCGLREEEEKFPIISFFNTASPGMSHVPEWLKSLRLHKYTNMIMSLTYEQMLELTEESLEKLDVTKGARKKIVSSVQKLKDRMSLLSSIDSVIENDCCDVKKVLIDLESILQSPIKVLGVNEKQAENVKERHDSARDSGTEVSGSEDDDEQDMVMLKPGCEGEHLVEKIMSSLRKVCSRLLLSQNTDLKFVSMFTNLLDICLCKDILQPNQKQLLLSWKHKILSIWGPLLPPHQPTSSYRKERKFLLPQSQLSHHLWGNNRFASRHARSNGGTFDPSLRPYGDSCHFEGRPVTNKHPLLLQRKSAPNIHSWQNFSSPVNFKKRSSFQDCSLAKTPVEIQQMTPVSDIYELPMLTPTSCEYVFNTRSLAEEGGVSPIPLNGGTNLVDNHFKADICDATAEPVSVVTNIFVTSPESPADSELNTRLESLCLSVTEHALN